MNQGLVRLLVLPIVIAGLQLPALAEQTNAASSKPVAAGRHLFILSGQSNMRQPLPESFEGVVTKVLGKDHVVVVCFSVPSQSINQWYKGWTPPEGVNYQPAKGEVNGALYDKLMGSVRRKVGQEKFATVTYVWMQGEADGAAGWGAVYEKSFLGILDQLKADLNLDQIRFVLGRINDTHPPKEGNGREVVRAAQVKLGSTHPNGAWVNTDDLNAGVNPWGGFEFNGEHFPNPGYRVLGQRLAAAALKLVDPAIQIDPTVLDARFFDTVAEIGTHAAVGAAISGTSPDAGHAGLPALTDGKYGSVGPADKAWVAFAPTQKIVELVVDLGQTQKVTAVAVNFLLHSQADAGFPVKADYAISSDGKTYESYPTRKGGISFMVTPAQQKALPPQSGLVLAEFNRADVRYVKITLTPGSFWLYVDEIMVNPRPKP